MSPISENNNPRIINNLKLSEKNGVEIRLDKIINIKVRGLKI
jgi:hypothetical protein